MKYYYGGHLLVALLGELTGTASAYVYNLGLAGVYAMLVTAVYEVAAAVAAAREESPRLAGVAAAFFVGAASNLFPAVRLVVSTLPSPVREDAARILAAWTARITVAQITGGLGMFSFWSASRVVPDTINEFPLFAWLFGDLHAHMLNAPFLVVGAAICHAYYRTPASALALIVEWLHVVDPATSGRTNTVFKSYVQLWVLWSVAAGVALPWLLGRGHASAAASRSRLAVPPLAPFEASLRSASRPAGPPLAAAAEVRRSRAGPSSPSWRRLAGVGLALLVVLSTSVYAVAALDNHFTGAANRTDDLRDTAPAATGAPPTLDATRFVARTHPGEAPAIAWLDARPGTPRLATAPGRAFTTWTSAPSTLTGLPTVAGWTHGRATRSARSRGSTG